jgi:hypothetical protein
MSNEIYSPFWCERYPTSAAIKIESLTALVAETRKLLDKRTKVLEKYASKEFWRNDTEEVCGYDVTVPHSAEAFSDVGELARNALDPNK